MPKVLLAEPRGFCAGVEMAIKALTWMVQTFEPPVYCYHEIVHNAAVVDAFQKAGVVFVDDVADVTEGRPVMLSAHGSAPEVVAAAEGQEAAIAQLCHAPVDAGNYPAAAAGAAAVVRAAGRSAAAAIAAARIGFAMAKPVAFLMPLAIADALTRAAALAGVASVRGRWRRWFGRRRRWRW